MSAKPLHPACILMVWFNRDVSGREVDLFPSANDSEQVRLRMYQTYCSYWMQFRPKKITDGDEEKKK